MQALVNSDFFFLLNRCVSVCVCVFATMVLGSVALAVISVMAARNLAKPLTSARYDELISRAFYRSQVCGCAV